MSDRLNNCTQFNEMIMGNFVSEGQICVDATAGNGNDTLALARLVGNEGLVYSFDIQEGAIRNTKKLIHDEGVDDRVRLIHGSHESISENINGPIDFMIYNLGYWPGGDKSIKTKADTTLRSINNALNFMAPGAIMLITAYKGHEGGLDEYEAVRKFTGELDQKNYNVFEFAFTNQKNNPPATIGVEVRGGTKWQR